jgi:hypothetical protein
VHAFLTISADAFLNNVQPHLFPEQLKSASLSFVMLSKIQRLVILAAFSLDEAPTRFSVTSISSSRAFSSAPVYYRELSLTPFELPC